MRAMVLVLSAIGVLLPAGARANCAQPLMYETKVAGTTVTICPTVDGRRTLLRQEPKSGAVVEVVNWTGECFVDECVPAGEYRYGYSEPWECASSACGTHYFGTAAVTAELAASCQPSEGRKPPAAYTGKVPWGDQQSICGYGGLGGCGSVAQAIWPVNLLALAGGLFLLRRQRR